MPRKSVPKVMMLLLIVLAVLSACDSEINPGVTITSPPPEETSSPIPELTATGDVQPTETQTEPTDILKLGGSIFIQNEEDLLTAFIISNTDPVNTAYNINYTVYAYDVNGATIGMDTGPIDLILPASNVGAVSEIWLDEPIAVAKVEVTWTFTSQESADYKSPFTAANTRYIKDLYFDVFTGILTNESDVSYTDIRINAVCFDKNGKIIGGGIGMAGILPGKEKVGINVYGKVIESPAAVIFYPTRSDFSASYEDGDWRNNLKVEDIGFVQDNIVVGGGFLVRNITDQVIKNSRYQVTLYEEDEFIGNIAEGRIDLIFPGETLGISPGSILVFTGTNPTKADVVILPGDFAEYEFQENPLIVQSAQFAIVEDAPKVTVMIKNTQETRITDLFLYVLLYDKKGDIVGGGTGWPENIEANSVVGVDVPVTYVGDEPPARVEAYPVLTIWSEIIP